MEIRLPNAPCGTRTDSSSQQRPAVKGHPVPDRRRGDSQGAAEMFRALCDDLPDGAEFA
jgi:hypothetical protein